MLLYCIIIILVYLFITNSTDEQYNKGKIIKTLVRQAARWSTAAKQDNNSMISVLHANYGAGYLWALRDIASDEEIKDATGVDILKFQNEIIQIQDDVTMKMGKLCPKYAPEESYLTKFGGER